MYKTSIAAALGSVAILAVTACAGNGHQAAGSAHLAATAHPAHSSAPAVEVTDANGEVCTAMDSSGYCPGDSPQPTTPTVAPITEVKFVVTGWASSSYGSGLDINYGSDSDSREYQFTGDFSGTWSRTLPFDPNANYYSINAQLSGGGDITVKIIAIGPSPDIPLTVSHGHAAGGYSIASAQAAPQNTDGTSWSDES